MRLILCIVLAGAVFGCSNIEQAKPVPQQSRADRSFSIDVPEIMQGTIAAETVVLGYESQNSPGYQPVVARGYGLVVGLNGTGSRDIPPQLRAHMLAMAAKGGMGTHRYGEEIANLSPEKLLDSMDTSVVLVEAIIPQGAMKGTKFDVRVVAMGSTSSLEGGRLYTAQLTPGPPTTGGPTAAPLAEAYGPIFVNPFAEPGAIGRDSIARTSGRILNGGTVIKDMPLKLRLSNPSHARAAILQSAINTRFPQEPSQREATARGESDEIIRINVPPSFINRTDEFIELLRHTTIAQGSPEAIAMAVRRTLVANPMVAQAAAQRWQSLGPRSLPIIKDLYAYPEEQPRLAALRAGAALDDALVVPHLLDMASNGTTDIRLNAIRLLADMRTNPRIDLALRNLLNDSDVEIRLESYEALVKRNDPSMQRFVVDGKFLLDVVESDKPMVYITQLGQPRIVVFGTGLEIDRPALVSAWSNRFMIKAESESQPLEVYYRSPTADQGVILRTEPNLAQFVSFLGHSTSVERPAPGLGLSYAETVGVLYHIWQQKYLNADFKAEQDRILAAIARLQDQGTVVDRPEFTDTSDSSPTNSGVESVPTSDLGRLEFAPQPSPPPSPATSVPTDPTLSPGGRN